MLDNLTAHRHQSTCHTLTSGLVTTPPVDQLHHHQSTSNTTTSQPIATPPVSQSQHHQSTSHQRYQLWYCFKYIFEENSCETIGARMGIFKHHDVVLNWNWLLLALCCRTLLSDTSILYTIFTPAPLPRLNTAWPCRHVPMWKAGGEILSLPHKILEHVCTVTPLCGTVAPPERETLRSMVPSSWLSSSNNVKIDTLVIVLPGVWRYQVSVSIPWLREISNLICSVYLIVAIV